MELEGTGIDWRYYMALEQRPYRNAGLSIGRLGWLHGTLLDSVPGLSAGYCKAGGNQQ